MAGHACGKSGPMHRMHQMAGYPRGNVRSGDASDACFGGSSAHERGFPAMHQCMIWGVISRHWADHRDAFPDPDTPLSPHDVRVRTSTVCMKMHHPRVARRVFGPGSWEPDRTIATATAVSSRNICSTERAWRRAGMRSRTQHGTSRYVRSAPGGALDTVFATPPLIRKGRS